MEIDIVPENVVCACTSAEGHKRQRLDDELAGGKYLITTAATSVPETVFNQLRKPEWIAALKVVQQIPLKYEDTVPFVMGVMNAELGRLFPQIEQATLAEKSIQIYEEMRSKNISFTLTATDVVLRTDHPGTLTDANINQPGDVTDEELCEIIQSKVGDCGDSRLKGGLIPAKFIVGMAACGINLNTGEILGQSGEVEVNFSFRPIPIEVIEKYVAEHGERARRVNGGIMWEYWDEYIDIINGLGCDEVGFDMEKKHLLAMTSGVPSEMSGFLYDLSNKNHLSTPGCAKKTTSNLRRMSREHLDRELWDTVKWCSWYPNYLKKKA